MVDHVGATLHGQVVGEKQELRGEGALFLLVLNNWPKAISICGTGLHNDVHLKGTPLGSFQTALQLIVDVLHGTAMIQSQSLHFAAFSPSQNSHRLQPDLQATTPSSEGNKASLPGYRRGCNLIITILTFS